MEKFHWAYIGCGGIAETTAKEILRSGEHEITAAWNRTRERAERTRRSSGTARISTPGSFPTWRGRSGRAVGKGA